MVPKVSLELVVATHHYSYFPNLSIPLSSGGCFGGSMSHSNLHTKFHALSPYISLAHFWLTLSVIRRTCRRTLAGSGLGWT